MHKIFGLDHGHSHGMSPQKSRNDVEIGGRKNSVLPTLGQFTFFHGNIFLTFFRR